MPHRRIGANSERGSTTVAVLAFLILMAMLVFGNSQSLKALKTELKRTEQIQLRKYHLPSGTNRLALTSASAAPATASSPAPIQP